MKRRRRVLSAITQGQFLGGISTGQEIVVKHGDQADLVDCAGASIN